MVKNRKVGVRKGQSLHSRKSERTATDTAATRGKWGVYFFERRKPKQRKYMPKSCSLIPDKIHTEYIR